VERWHVCGNVITEEPISIARDEYEWQLAAGRSHLFAQLESIQAGEPDVEDDAIEAVSFAGKFFG
jgi:hypothetical protein